MQRRRLGALEVSAVGLGCATMTPFYDEPDSSAAIDTVRHAREVGIDFLDSSDAYGTGLSPEAALAAVGPTGHVTAVRHLARNGSSSGPVCS
jgi:aryl-alcohol dehydrogenase-like predicted oxidoreductase